MGGHDSKMAKVVLVDVGHHNDHVITNSATDMTPSHADTNRDDCEEARLTNHMLRAQTVIFTVNRMPLSIKGGLRAFVTIF